MPPKPRFLPMPRDDTVLEARSGATEAWLESVRTEETSEKVRDFIIHLRCKKGQPKKMHPAIKGGYNLVYRLEYEDSTSVIMRVPIKDLVPFPEEKILYEVSTMRYVATNTTIPVPHVYHHGTAAQNPTRLGPFIIMDYIDHHTNMSRELLDPTKPPDSRPILDPNISEEKLELLYSQMAKILLQLYSLGPFPVIGSLVEPTGKLQHTLHDLQQQHETIQIKARPLTMNMTDIITDTHAPHNASALPQPTQTFTSSKDWYTALSDMHMAQLVYQENNCVEDEDDVRDKYTARKLFRYVAVSGGLFPSSMTPPSDGFRLFSEDLRPANVLLDEGLNIVGVIDWEFVYAAPVEFSTDPPWWLLVSAPEDYPGGIMAWMRDYEGRVGVFLGVLGGEEGRLDGEGGRWDGDGGEQNRGVVPRLSEQMRQSWETGRWMVNYAARKSWMFDLIWWRSLDGWYFGVNEGMDYRARLGMLSEDERGVMEGLVRRKMGEVGRGIRTDGCDGEDGRGEAGKI